MKNLYNLEEQYEDQIDKKPTQFLSEINSNAAFNKENQSIEQQANQNIGTHNNQANQFEEQLIPYKDIQSNCRVNFLLFCLPQCRPHNSKKVLLNISGQFQCYLVFLYMKNRTLVNSQFYPIGDRFEYLGGG